MTRHSDTLRRGDVIATYDYSRPDAAKRHAGSIDGFAVLNEETGLWEVIGTPQAEADRLLRETSDKDLLRQYRRSTYSVAALRDRERQANRENKAALASLTVERLADAEAVRDRIEAEVLRRMAPAATGLNR